MGEGRARGQLTAHPHPHCTPTHRPTQGSLASLGDDLGADSKRGARHFGEELTCTGLPLPSPSAVFRTAGPVWGWGTHPQVGPGKPPGCWWPGVRGSIIGVMDTLGVKGHCSVTWDWGHPSLRPQRRGMKGPEAVLAPGTFWPLSHSLPWPSPDGPQTMPLVFLPQPPGQPLGVSEDPSLSPALTK